jgi:hypothetical protein
MAPNFEQASRHLIHPRTRAHTQFCKEVLHLESSQVIWTKPDKQALCLDDAIDDAIVGNIREIVEARTDSDHMVVVPRYMPSFF